MRGRLFLAEEVFTPSQSGRQDYESHGPVGMQLLLLSVTSEVAKQLAVLSHPEIERMKFLSSTSVTAQTCSSTTTLLPSWSMKPSPTLLSSRN